MRELQLMVDYALDAQLEALWQRHGPWAILKSLVGTLWRRLRPRGQNHIGDLNNHMRRDVGLPDVVADTEHERALQFQRFL